MIMTSHQTDYIERTRNEIPSGVDPFEYLLQSLHSLMFPALSNGAFSALMFFLALHIFITVSCLTCLLVSLLPILRHRGNENQWILKRLYIKDEFGYKAHPTPLYLMNTGVLMSLAQLLGSIGAQVYIWTEYRSFKSPEYAMQARIAPSLGCMFTCEFYASWLMIWCFVVMLLYTYKPYAERLKCRPRSVISPCVINFSLISFPICATIVNMAVITILSSARTTQNERWQGFQNDLKKASMLWRQLNSISSSNSAEGNDELVRSLAEIMMQEQVSRGMVKASLEHLIIWIRITYLSWGAVLFPTCLVFTITFWKLIKQLNPKLDPLLDAPRRIFSFGPNPCPSSDLETVISESPSQGTGNCRFFFPHQQFLYLIVRAVAMVIGMLSTINFCIIGGIKSTEIIIDPTWRSTAMWLAVVSGTCSAIPVTFQCWRLYSAMGVNSTDSNPPYEVTEAAEMDVFRTENHQMRCSHSLGGGKHESRSVHTNSYSASEAKGIEELQTSNLLHVVLEESPAPRRTSLR